MAQRQREFCFGDIVHWRIRDCLFSPRSATSLVKIERLTYAIFPSLIVDRPDLSVVPP